MKISPFSSVIVNILSFIDHFKSKIAILNKNGPFLEIKLTIFRNKIDHFRIQKCHF